MEHVILTAIGQDRPGLVEEVTAVIAADGGSIEDSRMVNLRGQFAMMVLIRMEAAALEALKDRLPLLQRQSQLHAELHKVAPPQEAVERVAYRLRASALDRQGLVHGIAHLLSSGGVNIENLQTHLKPAPVSGAPTFEMELLVSVPAAASLVNLRQELARVCEEANIDWELEKC